MPIPRNTPEAAVLKSLNIESVSSGVEVLHDIDTNLYAYCENDGTDEELWKRDGEILHL